MGKRLLSTLLALSLAGCANQFQTVDQQLKAALAGEPVVVTEQENGRVSNLFKPSGKITLISSADYLYPSGDWRLRPGAPVLSKMVPTFRSLQNTTITVVGYTDNTPIGPQLERMGIANNVDLSLKRASEAVAYVQSQGTVLHGSCQKTGSSMT
jgi:chemotaxis protein MotB